MKLSKLLLVFVALLSTGSAINMTSTDVNAAKVSSLKKLNRSGDTYTWKDKTKVINYKTGKLDDYTAKPLNLTKRNWSVMMFTKVSKAKKESMFNDYSNNNFVAPKKLKKSDYLVYIVLTAKAKNTSKKSISFNGLIDNGNVTSPDGVEKSVSSTNLGGNGAVDFDGLKTKKLTYNYLIGKAKNYKDAKKLVQKGNWQFNMGITNSNDTQDQLSNGDSYNITIK